MATEALTRSDYFREKREDIRSAAMRLEIGAFDLMERTSNLVRRTVKEEFGKAKSRAGVAVFLHGSPARNEMTTYGDLDIMLVGRVPREAVDAFYSGFTPYGFEKLDTYEPGWQWRQSIERCARHSIVDGNKVLDASFVAGDTFTRGWMLNLQSRENTLARAMGNIIFQRYYLEHHYALHSTAESPSVKFSNGGTRDFLMLDWFDNAMRLYRGAEWKAGDAPTRPRMESALRNMLRNGIISQEQFKSAEVSVGFVSLLRNQIQHVNQGTEDERMTHLDARIHERVFDSAPHFFREHGVSSPEGVGRAFEQHRARNQSLKERLISVLLDEEERRSGRRWRATFDSAERGEVSSLGADRLVNIAAIWGLHRARRTNELNAVPVFGQGWEINASLACSDLARPELLESLRAYASKNPEQGYVLRIIGRNPNASDETLGRIARDRRLGSNAAVAKKRIEGGLSAAINKT